VTDVSDLGRRLSDALGDGYAVEKPLGEGGFAVVFLVRDVALKRGLAVKVLSPDVITSHAMLERFRREAETVAQLSHPHIVPVHFIGQKDELLWLAMQLVDGGSIADRLAREGRMPVDDAVRVIREVASALDHAHKRGIIHRDIKPANVLVDIESGRALVTDFGIARTVDAATLTATGVMLGTPAYLSPEQVTGEPIDHRIDIYALGVMAYEMIAGRLPFEGATPTAAMMKRLAGPPELVSTVRADVPTHIAEAIGRSLASNPDDRFQSAGDFSRALGGETVTGPTPPVVTNKSTSRSLIVGVAAAVVVVLAGGAWWLSRSPSPTIAPAIADSTMIAIPAGDYVVGTDSGPSLARPRHTAHVDAFAIGRHEVTVGEYETFLKATNAPAPWTGAMPSATLPVTRVSWADAANYCAWKHGRLPTETEWEAAARGADGRAYPYGNSADESIANTESAHRAGPAPVGSFPRGATREGAEDMSGNVWEWTSSPLTAYPGATPLPDSMSQFRVIRGGAFNTADSLATAWMRGYARVSAQAADLQFTGFRCVTPAK
jgi:serine/threonine-protein kinase